MRISVYVHSVFGSRGFGINAFFVQNETNVSREGEVEGDDLDMNAAATLLASLRHKVPASANGKGTKRHREACVESAAKKPKTQTGA